VTAAAMTAVMSNSIARHKATHDSGHGRSAGLEQEMKVIRDQRPGKTPGFTFCQNFAKPMDKIVAILIVAKYDSALNSPRNDVVHRTRASILAFLGMPYR